MTDYTTAQAATGGRGSGRPRSAVVCVLAAAGIVFLIGGCSHTDSSDTDSGEGTAARSGLTPGTVAQDDTSTVSAGRVPTGSQEQPTSSEDSLAVSEVRSEADVDTAKSALARVSESGRRTGESTTAGAGDARAAPSATESGPRVARAYVCKGIEESEPTEAGRSFIPEEDGLLRLCCFSEIEGAAGPDLIYHVWYWGDREMARVELPVKGPSWRTWSSKQIADEWRGEWHVDITDRDGDVLATLVFSVE